MVNEIKRDGILQQDKMIKIVQNPSFGSWDPAKGSSFIRHCPLIVQPTSISGATHIFIKSPARLSTLWHSHPPYPTPSEPERDVLDREARLLKWRCHRSWRRSFPFQAIVNIEAWSNNQENGEVQLKKGALMTNIHSPPKACSIGMKFCHHTLHLPFLCWSRQWPYLPQPLQWHWPGS